MSTGYANNNPGNINYYGTNWEGSTGNYKVTADGQKNIEFLNMIYGIRALMVIMNTKISRGTYNTMDILRSYSPGQTETERYKRAVGINNKYFGGALPEDDILDLGDNSIIGLTKGIIEGEIPEWKQIPANYYDVALRYFNSGNDLEASTYTVKQNSSTFAGTNIWLLLAIAGAGLYWYTRKNK
jgi:hypothetical protein